METKKKGGKETKGRKWQNGGKGAEGEEES